MKLKHIDIDHFDRLWLDGAPIKTIAHTFGTSKSNISLWARRRGMQARQTRGVRTITKHLSTSVTEEMYRAANERARDRGLTICRYVRELIAADLAKKP
jgi:uncharacterized protein YjcR